jgi:V-type H+-transporting ATPase subunit E
MVSSNGRISLDNTFEERLRLLEDKVSFVHITACLTNASQMLPEIRYELFGRNTNRKFYT